MQKMVMSAKRRHAIYAKRSAPLEKRKTQKNTRQKK
jgi:hypothetical protein